MVAVTTLSQWQHPCIQLINKSRIFRVDRVIKITSGSTSGINLSWNMWKMFFPNSLGKYELQKFHWPCSLLIRASIRPEHQIEAFPVPPPTHLFLYSISPQPLLSFTRPPKIHLRLGRAVSHHSLGWGKDPPNFLSHASSQSRSTTNLLKIFSFFQRNLYRL